MHLYHIVFLINEYVLLDNNRMTYVIFYFFFLFLLFDLFFLEDPYVLHQLPNLCKCSYPFSYKTASFVFWNGIKKLTICFRFFIK